jgi:hypothetical protein
MPGAEGLEGKIVDGGVVVLFAFRFTGVDCGCTVELAGIIPSVFDSVVVVSSAGLP